MSLTNEQKLEILANSKEVEAAVTLMIAAFKEMELNTFFSIPYQVTDGRTGEKEVYAIMFMKQHLGQAK